MYITLFGSLLCPTLTGATEAEAAVVTGYHPVSASVPRAVPASVPVPPPMPPPPPTGATVGTAGPRGAGVACGGGGGASAANGAGCVLAGCSRFVTGIGRVPAGGGREEVVPEKAAATPLPAAVGREAACCSPRHLAVADEGSHRLKAVRGGDGRQRQRRSRSPPRWHRDKIKKNAINA